ncbi:MAG: metallophosphoesterase [Candidatus Helarchaeota archaeon]
MNIIKPLINEPALIIKLSPTKKIVVIADLHLGIEHTLIEGGAQIPSQTQTQRLIDRLLKIVDQVQPTHLIILGDIKHSVPKISPMEWHIVPYFFKSLKHIPIHIILGNHDSEAQIEGLTTRNTIIHPASGCLLTLIKDDTSIKIGLFHGHTWPRKDLLNADILIMAHNHPVIEFQDDFNVKIHEPAWIRLHWDQRKLASAYLNYLHIKKAKDPLTFLKEKYKIQIASNPEIIIIPAFNDLLGGIPFNVPDSQFLGPLFKSKSLNLDDAEAILLDGTPLGKIKEIRLKT